MPTIKRFKISDTDPLAVIDLGWSMEFLEDDLGNFAIAPPHVICRAGTPAEAARTVDLLNAVAPLAETIESLKSIASSARWALDDDTLRRDGRAARAVKALTLWACGTWYSNRRLAKDRLAGAEKLAKDTLADFDAVIRKSK